MLNFFNRIRKYLFTLVFVFGGLVLANHYNQTTVKAEETTGETTADTTTTDTTQENKEYTINVHYDSISYTNFFEKQKGYFLKEGYDTVFQVVNNISFTTTETTLSFQKINRTPISFSNDKKTMNITDIVINKFADKNEFSSDVTYYNDGDKLENIDTDGDGVIDLYAIYAVPVKYKDLNHTNLSYSSTNTGGIDSPQYVIFDKNYPNLVLSEKAMGIFEYEVTMEYYYKTGSRDTQRFSRSIEKSTYIDNFSKKEVNGSVISHFHNISLNNIHYNLDNFSTGRFYFEITRTKTLKSYTYTFDFNDSTRDKAYVILSHSKTYAKNSFSSIKDNVTNSILRASFTDTNSFINQQLKNINNSHEFIYMPVLGRSNYLIKGWIIDNKYVVGHEFAIAPLLINNWYDSDALKKIIDAYPEYGLTNYEFMIQGNHTFKAIWEPKKLSCPIDMTKFESIEARYTSDDALVDFEQLDYGRTFKFTNYKLKKGYKLSDKSKTAITQVFARFESKPFNDFTFTTENFTLVLRNLIYDRTNSNYSFNVNNLDLGKYYGSDNRKPGKKFVGWSNSYNDTITESMVIPSEFFDDKSNNKCSLTAVYEDITYNLELIENTVDGLKSFNIVETSGVYGQQVHYTCVLEKGYKSVLFEILDENGNRITTYRTDESNTYSIPDSTTTNLKVRVFESEKKYYEVNYEYDDLIRIDAYSAYANETNQITINPNAAINVTSLKFINGETGESIPFEKIDSTTYEILMPYANVTIVYTYEFVEFKLEFDFDGGSLTTDVQLPTSYILTENYDTNEVIVNVNPTKNGYNFYGWNAYSRDEYNNLSNLNNQNYGNGKGSPEPMPMKGEPMPMKGEPMPSKGRGKGDYVMEYPLYLSDLINVNSTDVVLVANWSPKSYTIKTMDLSGLLDINYSDTYDYQSDISWYLESVESDIKYQIERNEITEIYGGLYTDINFEHKVDFTTMPANNVVLYVKWLKDSYTIKFVDANNNVISEEVVKAGVMPTIPSENPTKSADLTATYTFSGWSPVVGTASADTTYSPVFTSEPISFDIVFINDGQVISSNKYTFGQRIVFPANPSKEMTISTEYTFISWSETDTICMGSKTYSAIYKESPRKYTITWDVDGNIITDSVEYGIVPEFNGNTTKQSDKKYDYIFKGWDTPVTVVVCDASYTAVYEQSIKEFDITFYDALGDVIKTVSYKFGETVEAPSEYASFSLKEGVRFNGWVNEHNEPINPLLSIEDSIQAYPSFIDANNNTFVNKPASISNAENVSVKVTPLDSIEGIDLSPISDNYSSLRYFNVARYVGDRRIANDTDGAIVSIQFDTNEVGTYRTYFVKADGSLEEINYESLSADGLVLNMDSLGNVIVRYDDIPTIGLAEGIKTLSISAGVLATMCAFVFLRTRKKNNKIAQYEERD